MSPPSNPLDAFRTITKHDTYYIAGADLCLMVENMQFRVHRFFFERESTYFTRKLATPASPGQEAQGTSDSNAIVLEDVTPDHFAKFLWIFYNPLYSLYDAQASDWEIILGLAVRWEFPEVKNLAVRELEKKEIPDSKRIKLYHANHVDENILIPRYAALCEREDSLTIEEGEDIGLKTVLLIAKGREEARAQRLSTGGRTPLSPTTRGTDLYSVVREVFKIAETPSAPIPDPTGGLPIKTTTQKTSPTKRQTAQTAPAPILQATRPSSATILAGKPRVVSRRPAAKPIGGDDTKEPLSAQKSDGSVAGAVDDPFDTLEAAGDATAESVRGTGDDLLGIFTGFNQTPSSSTVPPISLFDSFSSFGNSGWSQNF